MVIIVNFWVGLSPAMEAEIAGVAQIVNGPSVAATTFPLLNVSSTRTLRTLRFFPERGTEVLPTGLWNCYARGEDLSDFVVIREDLQELEDKYYPDLWVGGAWNYADGEPIGGVGSPWFTYPGNLLSILPGNLLQQIVLMAGQAKRKFV